MLERIEIEIFAECKYTLTTKMADQLLKNHGHLYVCFCLVHVS